VNWYNENDPFAAAWLRELIRAGLIPKGEVDERSIVDVRGGDLAGFSQCHFFAGIGGWSRALELARWPQDREVWTGSCPCQPLSVAGQGRGHVDERHLWPAFQRLIAERRPATVFGEQVAGKHGLEWFAGVRADLEAGGYACGGAVIPACAVGAPHRRERLFWVADAQNERRPDWNGGSSDRAAGEFERLCDGLVADAGQAGWGEHAQCDGEANGPSERASRRRDIAGHGDAGLVGDAAPCGRLVWNDRIWASQRDAGGFWSDAVWLAGADGKMRRVKPGVRLLAHGVPNRVGRLRGYGNSIIAPLAAKFIEAYMSIA
jgi:DNA (cytosine-5)-methyltransferase 1